MRILFLGELTSIVTLEMDKNKGLSDQLRALKNVTDQIEAQHNEKTDSHVKTPI